MNHLPAALHWHCGASKPFTCRSAAAAALADPIGDPIVKFKSLAIMIVTVAAAVLGIGLCSQVEPEHLKIENKRDWAGPGSRIMLV